MSIFLYNETVKYFRKIVSSFIVLTFLTSLIVTPVGLAADGLGIPSDVASSVRLAADGLGIPSDVASSVTFQPPVLLGLKIHPENPLLFDFIVDQGQSKLSTDELKSETEKLVKYFLAALTIPDKDVWVNLSPTEKDRIIPDVLGQTIMGKTMLEQDYLLKQLASSLTNPETDLGKKYWDQVNAAQTVDDRRSLTSNPKSLTPNQLNKVWIMPAKAEVLESNGIVLVGEKRLKVMMAQEYDAQMSSLRKQGSTFDNQEKLDSRFRGNDNISSQIFRTTILPAIDKSVNESKDFADVRRIYNSVILAAWYKKALKESLLGKIYTDKGKVAGVETDDKEMKQRIYKQYLAAFKKGAYNLIKEEADADGELIPRKYFSGGEALDASRVIEVQGGLNAEVKIEGTLRGSSRIITARTQLATEQPELELLATAAQEQSSVASSAVNVEQAVQIFTNLPSDLTRLREYLGEINDVAFSVILEAAIRVPGNDEYFSIEDHYYFTLAKRNLLTYVGKRALIEAIVRLKNKEKPQDNKPTLKYVREFLSELKAYLHPFNIAKTGNQAKLLANDFRRLETIRVELQDSLGVTPSLNSYVVVAEDYKKFQNIQEHFKSLHLSFESLQGLNVSMGERYNVPSQVAKKMISLLKVVKWPRGNTALNLVVETTMALVDGYPAENSGELKRDLLDQLSSANFHSPYLKALKARLSFDAKTQPSASSALTITLTGKEVRNIRALGIDPQAVQMVIDRAKESFKSRGQYQWNSSIKISAVAEGKISSQEIIDAANYLGLRLNRLPYRENGKTKIGPESILVIPYQGNFDDFIRKFIVLNVSTVQGWVDPEYATQIVKQRAELLRLNRVLTDAQEIVAAFQKGLFKRGDRVRIATLHGSVEEEITAVNGQSIGKKVTKIDGATIVRVGNQGMLVKDIQSIAMISLQSSASSGILNAKERFTLDSDPVGGIDFDSTNMNLQIKRDGRGVPLPLPQQNLEQINIQGLFPVIINIVPMNAQTLPILLGQASRETAKEIERNVGI